MLAVVGCKLGNPLPLLWGSTIPGLERTKRNLTNTNSAFTSEERIVPHKVLLGNMPNTETHCFKVLQTL